MNALTFLHNPIDAFSHPHSIARSTYQEQLDLLACPTQLGIRLRLQSCWFPL